MPHRFKMKRVLLAVPGELRREAVGAALCHSGFAIAAQGDNLQMVCATGKRIDADLLVFERKSPNDADYHSLRRFKEAIPSAGAIMLAERVCRKELHYLLDAGVDAIVDRRGSLRSLVSYARLVLRGQGAVQPCLLVGAEFVLEPTTPFSALALAPGLSEREHTVASLLAKGLTDKEIARQLDLVHGTVRNYVRSIQQKLSLANRTQVAVWALEHGIVDKAVSDAQSTPIRTHASVV